MKDIDLYILESPNYDESLNYDESFKNNKAGISSERAAITVEAAITLPVFICVIVSVVFIMKIVYVHELIQHAISETAYQMADMGYIFCISGAGEIHDTLRDGMESKAELFRRHSSEIMNSLDDLSRICSNENIKDTGNRNITDTKNIAEAIEEISQNPIEELKSMGFAIASGIFSDIKTDIFLPAVKSNIKKYLNIEGQADINTVLQRLNIENGFNGLDFSESSFLNDQNNDIDIVVKYKMSLPLPVKILPKVLVVQRASAKAWMQGNGGRKIGGEEEDIWSLDNFQRGTRLRKIFGTNLPYNFPVIASFKDGTAGMIKSMDITADSYQTADSVRKKVYEYIDELADYQGQEKSWGRSGIAIREDEIMKRNLVLIIPGNSIEPAIERELYECVNYADSKGVILIIERYGMKKIE